MEELKQRILKDGVARKEGGIVRVGSFLNHQLDPQLMMLKTQLRSKTDGAHHT